LVDQKNKIIMTKKYSDRKVVSFDWAIKYALRDKINYQILEGFLSTLLDQPIEVEEILESETNATTEDDKQVVVDVLCKTVNKELILIEVQFATQLDFFQRIIFSTSKILSERLKKGEGFHKVVKIYAVSLVYFNLGVGKDYVYWGRTQFRGMNNNEVLSTSRNQMAKYNRKEPGDIFPEFILLRLNAFNGDIKSQLDEWLYYFKNMELPEHYTSKSLTLIAEKLKINDMKVEELKAYKEYHDKVAISKSALMTSFEEGVIEGHQEGRLMEKEEVILNAYARQMAIADIAALVKYEEAEVLLVLQKHRIL